MKCSRNGSRIGVVTETMKWRRNGSRIGDGSEDEVKSKWYETSSLRRWSGVEMVPELMTVVRTKWCRNDLRRWSGVEMVPELVTVVKTKWSRNGTKLDDGSVDELAVVTELAVDGAARIFTHTGNLYAYECSIRIGASGCTMRRIPEDTQLACSSQMRNYSE